MILEEYKLKKKGQCHIHSEVYIVQLFRSGGGGGGGGWNKTCGEK